MCERVDTRTVNRKVLEALIKSGRVRFFRRNRATMFAQIDRALARATSIVQDRQRGAKARSSAASKRSRTDKSAKRMPSLPEWPQHEILAHEKELLGFYVTGHPLTPYAPLLENYALHNS